MKNPDRKTVLGLEELPNIGQAIAGDLRLQVSSDLKIGQVEIRTIYSMNFVAGQEKNVTPVY